MQTFCRPLTCPVPVLLACVQMSDAPPAAASPAGRSVGKATIDQTTPRDTNTECDSPRKAVPAGPVLDAPPSIWEKLASHEVRRNCSGLHTCQHIHSTLPYTASPQPSRDLNSDKQQQQRICEQHLSIAGLTQSCITCSNKPASLLCMGVCKLGM
jgi:hypothetical protein